MAAITICSDFEGQENKFCSLFSPSIYQEVMGPDAMIFILWMLSFKPAFSLSFFTCIKKFFSFSSFSAISVVSSAYLSLLIFLLAILIAYASSSLVFCRMYSTWKLNKQSDNIKLWHTPFPNWNKSIFMLGSNCCFLTCIQTSQEASRVAWYSHLMKNFPQFIVIHTVKGFSIINEAEVDISLEFCSFLYDPMDIGNLISGFSAFLNPAYTSGSSWFTYCWRLAWRILSITLLTCEMSIIVQ